MLIGFAYYVKNEINKPMKVPNSNNRKLMPKSLFLRCQQFYVYDGGTLERQTQHFAS